MQRLKSWIMVTSTDRVVIITDEFDVKKKPALAGFFLGELLTWPNPHRSNYRSKFAGNMLMNVPKKDVYAE